MRRITAAAVVLLLMAACSSGDETSSTTSGPTTTATTLLAASSTTTLPPRAVTSVDACSLLTDTDLEPVLDEPSAGEPTPTDAPDPAEGVPAFITAECSWPSRDDPQLVLTYLAPTTAPDGVTHLQQVLEADTGFAEGGRVVPQQAGNQTVGVLIDGEEEIRELAVVKRSALVYLLVDQGVGARDAEALTTYARVLLAALVRAPR